MKIVELIRLEESKEGTIGALKIDKQCFCWTLEPSDKLNKQNVSSIPAQQYICEKVVSRKYGTTFLVLNVPNRSSILFHPGNTIDDTKGCILLGKHPSKLRGKRAVLNSGFTFKQFIHEMKEVNQFHLTITTNY
jgi:hypothetical protein